MRRTLLSLAAALLLVPASLAAGKNPGKALLDKLEKGSKTAIEGLEDAIAGHRASLGLQIDAVEQYVKSGSFVSPEVALFNALESFQIAVRDSIKAAGASFGATQQAALVDWEEQGLATSDLPKGCRYGESGPVESFRVRVRATVEKQYAKVDKALAKLAKVFEVEAGIGLVCRIDPPPAAVEFIANDYGSPQSGPSFAVGVDLVVATSHLATPNDADVRMGGHAYSGTSLGVSYFLSTGGGSSIAGPVAASNHRWSHTWKDWSEQNIVFGVFINGASGTGASMAISLR